MTRLADLPGNRPVGAALLRALGSGRLPHALLFHGPAGSGKQAAALALAAALLCPRAADDACGVCDQCRRVAASSHPDLVRVEREGTFVKVGAARELARESYLKPYAGRAKVFIVPEAECFNDEAANALLKTLEEPPPATYIVLVSASREAVLPTLRSRCQALAFRAPDRAALAARLTAEGVAPAEAALRAAIAQGDLARARALDLGAWRAARDELLGLLERLGGGRLSAADAERLLGLAETAARKERSDELVFGVLRPLLRDCLVLAAGGPEEVLVNADRPPGLGAAARALGAAGASRALAELDRAELDVKANLNRRLLLEGLLLGVFLDGGKVLDGGTGRFAPSIPPYPPG